MNFWFDLQATGVSILAFRRKLSLCSCFASLKYSNFHSGKIKSKSEVTVNTDCWSAQKQFVQSGCFINSSHQQRREQKSEDDTQEAKTSHSALVSRHHKERRTYRLKTRLFLADWLMDQTHMRKIPHSLYNTK